MDGSGKTKEEDVIEYMRALMKQFGISLAELRALPPESPSPLSAALPRSVACNKPLSIEDVRNAAREFASGQDLFSQWYFGQEGVRDLVSKVNHSRRVQIQNRTCIGLVQATMMGKTRLLLEASKHTPLILIRLDNSNVVYERLLDYVEQEKAKITPRTSFDQWQSLHRRVMLYIRAFFLSYMLYALEYKQAHEKRLFVPDKLAEVKDEIDLFNASLLNSGQLYVRSLFVHDAEELLKIGDDALEEALRRIEDRHDALSRELNRPTLAIDECHMPLREAVGMLFHADYKDREQEDVVRWQRYELFHAMAMKETTMAQSGRRKGAPHGYPYSSWGGPTTLFSGFRWVLQKYLERPEVHQTAIFSSTVFSVWEPFKDVSSKYSRDRPLIRRVYLERMLSCEDILEVIGTIENRSIDGDERKAASRHPSAGQDREDAEEAEAHIAENTLSTGLPILRETKSITLDPARGVAVTGDDIVRFLCHCYRLRGGNINCSPSVMAKLVSAGFAIVQNYVPDPNGKSVGVVAEPLVHNFLDHEVEDLCLAQFETPCAEW